MLNNESPTRTVADSRSASIEASLLLATACYKVKSIILLVVPFLSNPLSSAS